MSTFIIWFAFELHCISDQQHQNYSVSNHKLAPFDMQKNAMNKHRDPYLFNHLSSA